VPVVMKLSPLECHRIVHCESTVSHELDERVCPYRFVAFKFLWYSLQQLLILSIRQGHSRGCVNLDWSQPGDTVYETSVITVPKESPQSFLHLRPCSGRWVRNIPSGSKLCEASNGYLIRKELGAFRHELFETA
jgi:hypothetical protein